MTDGMTPDNPNWPKKPDGTPMSQALGESFLRGKGQTPGGGPARRAKSDGPGDDYVEVKERIQVFYATYPTGSIVTDRVVPFAEGEIDGSPRIMVQAKAYRTPDDPHPGVGTSWMVLPGRTPYTNGSELENCETSAWGRAIAATGILVDRGIASAQEIRMKGGGEIEPPSRTNADALRMAAEAAAAPATEPDSPAPSGAQAPPVPEQVTAVPPALSGETGAVAAAPAAAPEIAEGQAGLSFEEFKRMAREKFIPNGHIATTARDLVERGALPQVGGVKEFSDEERLTLLMVALAKMDYDPQETK